MIFVYLDICGKEKTLKISKFNCLTNGYFSVEYLEEPGKNYLLYDLERVLSVELI